MKLVILFVIFCFFKTVFCYEISKVVDLQYVKKTHSTEGSMVYFLDQSNNFWFTNTSDLAEKSIQLIKLIPLENPKILGSFSNNSMFFVGTRYQELFYDYQILDPLFKPILLISHDKNQHYSMNLQNDGKSIDFFSMTTKRNLGIDYFSISIETLNVSDTNFDNVINLNTSTNYKLFLTNISVDPNSIESFKFSHDKLNNIYFCLIKEKGNNKTWIVSLENGSLEMFSVDIGYAYFGNLVFMSTRYKSFMISSYETEGRALAVLCDLKNNTTKIEERVLEGTHSKQLIRETFKDFMYLTCQDFYCYFETISSNDFSYKATRPVRIERGIQEAFDISSIYLVYREMPILIEGSKGNGMIIVAILVPVITVSIVILIGSLYYIIVVKKSKSKKQNQTNLESGIGEIKNEKLKSGADLDID